MNKREEKARKRAILLAMLNQDDWINDESKLSQVQQFTNTEILQTDKERSKGGRPTTVTISEKEFLYYVYQEYDYDQIRKVLGVTKGQLVKWRMEHDFFRVPRKQLKQEYIARFLSQGKKGES